MKSIFITGANSGLGLAMVRTFLQAGYAVIASVRNLETVDSLDELRSSFSDFMIVGLDLLDEDSIDTAIELALQRFGAIDVLINNAGVAIPSVIEEVSADQTRIVMGVNFFGPLSLIQRLLPQMRQQNSGIILNVSSLSAHIGLPCDGIYSASKIALERCSESLKSEVAPFGVRVNNAIPGKINTPMAKKMRQSIKANTSSDYSMLLRRLGEEMQGSDLSGTDPDDIAKEIVTLVEQGDSAFHVPVGDQARAIMRQLMMLTEQQRNQLIAEFSIADWWLNNVS